MLWKILIASSFALLFPISVFGYSSEMKNEAFINRLALCESENKWHIKIVDTNGQYSYSGLQFQLRTFDYFGKLYGILPKEFSLEESRLMIFRESVQRAVALAMLKDGLVDDHWKICYKKVII